MILNNFKFFSTFTGTKNKSDLKKYVTKKEMSIYFCILLLYFDNRSAVLHYSMILNIKSGRSHVVNSRMFSNIFIKWCQPYYDNNNNVDDDDAVKSSFCWWNSNITYSKNKRNNCVSIKEINDDRTLPSYYYKNVHGEG